MNFKEIQELIKLVDKSELAEFKLKTNEIQIEMRNHKYFKNAGITQVSPMMSLPSVSPAAPAIAIPQNQGSAASEMPSAPAKEEAAAPKANLIEVRSPMVGTFYRSAGPGKPPFVNVGDSISKGSPICIIEAMKLFNEIESEFAGKVAKVMVEDASPVEYDQVLFLLEP